MALDIVKERIKKNLKSTLLKEILDSISELNSLKTEAQALSETDEKLEKEIDEIEEELKGTKYIVNEALAIDRKERLYELKEKLAKVRQPEENNTIKTEVNKKSFQIDQLENSIKNKINEFLFPAHLRTLKPDEFLDLYRMAKREAEIKKIKNEFDAYRKNATVYPIRKLSELTAEGFYKIVVRILETGNKINLWNNTLALQKYLVCDETGEMDLIIWNNHKTFENGKAYQITGCYLKEFKGDIQINLSRIAQAEMIEIKR
jgi:hypothetical protein